jgi:hypothetical protein
MIYPGCNKPLPAFPLSFREPYQAAFLRNLALSAAVTISSIDRPEIGPRANTKSSFWQWEQIKVSVTATVVPPHVIDPTLISRNIPPTMRDIAHDCSFIDLPSYRLLHIIDQQNYSILDMSQLDFGVGDYAYPGTAVAQCLNRDSYC